MITTKNILAALTQTDVREPRVIWVKVGEGIYQPVPKGTWVPFAKRLRLKDVTFKQVDESDRVYAFIHGEHIWARAQQLEVL